MRRSMPVREAHEDAKCRDRKNCTGPGCNLRTGKTAQRREHNPNRPRWNKAGAESTPPDSPKYLRTHKRAGHK